MGQRLHRLLRHPTAVTVTVLIAVAVVLPLRRGFHPGEWYFVLYAAAFVLPGAAWAQTVIQDLALSGIRGACIVVLSWFVPLSLYGLFAGPVWVCLGATENDLRFAAAGIALFIAACTIATAVVLLERRRRARAAAQLTGA